MFVSSKLKVQPPKINYASVPHLSNKSKPNLCVDTISFTSARGRCEHELMEVFKKYKGDGNLFSHVNPICVKKLAEKITTNPKTPIRIGVTGVSGSGKGFFAKIFKQTLYETNEVPVAIINRDNYLLDYSKEAKTYNGGAIGYAIAGNLEGDKCIDFQRITGDRKKLENGQTVYPKKRHRESGIVEPHDFKNPIEPAKITIVEGVSLFKNKKFFNSLDITVYVDVDEKAVKQRWFKRAPSRGKVGEAAVDFYQTIKPISNECTIKFKNVSDIVINPEMRRNSVESFSKDFAEVLKKYS